MKIFLLLLFAAPLLCPAQDTEPSDYQNKSFVILGSFKQRNDALKMAEQAAKKLGLSYPDQENNFSPRGHYNDDSTFISVEPSHLYRNFKKDLYLVVCATGWPNDKTLKPLLKRAKKYYPDAYIKTTAVYMGPLH